jgi:hypothetical protein
MEMAISFLLCLTDFAIGLEVHCVYIDPEFIQSPDVVLEMKTITHSWPLLKDR